MGWGCWTPPLGQSVPYVSSAGPGSFFLQRFSAGFRGLGGWVTPGWTPNGGGGWVFPPKKGWVGLGPRKLSPGEKRAAGCVVWGFHPRSHCHVEGQGAKPSVLSLTLFLGQCLPGSPQTEVTSRVDAAALVCLLRPEMHLYFLMPLPVNSAAAKRFSILVSVCQLPHCRRKWHVRGFFDDIFLDSK